MVEDQVCAEPSDPILLQLLPKPALAAEGGLLAAVLQGLCRSEDHPVALIPAWSLATHFVHWLCKSSAALVI